MRSFDWKSGLAFCNATHFRAIDFSQSTSTSKVTQFAPIFFVFSQFILQCDLFYNNFIHSRHIRTSFKYNLFMLMTNTSTTTTTMMNQWCTFLLFIFLFAAIECGGTVCISANRLHKLLSKLLFIIVQTIINILNSR